MTKQLIIGLGALAAILTGCGSATPEPTTGLDMQGGAATAQTQGGEQASAGTGSCQLREVHFGYDSSDLDQSARDGLVANAHCIEGRNLTTVTVVGMADPRGTEEYNLALGDRRAQTAKHYLTDMGVPAERVQTSSMGEELASGTDESSWAHDRRAEVKAE